MPGPDNQIPRLDETVEERHRRLQAQQQVIDIQDKLISAGVEPVQGDGFDPTESRRRAREIMSHTYGDEPVFVFRAKDILSTFALDEYSRVVEKFDPGSPLLVSLTDALIEFRYWQRTNPDKVKLPD